MAYLTCPGNIDFSPVPSLISTETVIPKEKGWAVTIHILCTYTLYSNFACAW